MENNSEEVAVENLKLSVTNAEDPKKLLHVEPKNRTGTTDSDEHVDIQLKTVKDSEVIKSKVDAIVDNADKVEADAESEKEISLEDVSSEGSIENLDMDESEVSCQNTSTKDNELNVITKENSMERQDISIESVGDGEIVIEDALHISEDGTDNAMSESVEEKLSNDTNNDVTESIVREVQTKLSDSADEVNQMADDTNEIDIIENAVEDSESVVEHIIIESEAIPLAEEQIVIEGDAENPVEESVSSNNEISEGEYHLIINDNETSVISVNGVAKTNKQEAIILENSGVLEHDNIEAAIELTLGEVPTTNSEDGHDVVVVQEENVVMIDEFEQSQDDGGIVSNNVTSEVDDKIKDLRIPCHVLGRNIENPLEDSVRNGRVLLKPRLGVKIPYRNLTSQIVSKQDITNEIMERSRLRQSSSDPPAGGDIFFANKLTQRLAKKIKTPSKTKPLPSSSSKKSQIIKTTASTSDSIKLKNENVPKVPEISKQTLQTSLNTSKKITDNSDLIALLEGDDDDTDWTAIDPKATKIHTSQKRSADWERETALKQLRELPKLTKATPPILIDILKQGGKSEIALNISKHSSSEELKEDFNSEPKFSSSSVTKTYTRKRKPSEDIKHIATTILQSPKKFIPVEPKETATPSTQKSLKITPVKTNSTSTTTASLPKSTTVTVVKSSVALKPVLTPLKTGNPKTTANVQNSQKQTGSSTIQKAISNPNLQKAIDKKQITVKVEKKMVSPTKTPEFKALSPNTYISKSSRIIKRKKIWDPDEATPSFRSTPVKPHKVASEKSAEKKAASKASNETPAKSARYNFKPSDKTKKTINRTIMKKRKQKRLTEIDRLLMDEGAVNLLYAARNAEQLQNLGRKKKSRTVISLDKMQKELLNKTNEIKNDLQMNSTRDLPISLRKKEGVISKTVAVKDLAALILQRKKSKDSMAGSVHSPPASPGFTYSQHAEASRIIRRHSSSSFSSENAEAEESASRGKNKSTSSEHKLDLQKKKLKAISDKHPLIGRNLSVNVDKLQIKDEMIKNFNKTLSEDEYSRFGTFHVRRFDNLVQIILAPTSTNGQTALSMQVLMELAVILDLLENDSKCRVVLFSSSGNSFCQGIDYKELTLSTKGQNQNIIQRYANCVREFLLALSKFSKILVAGVHGNTIGLGVTMLPLFDMVLASDTATFSTPYAQIGCAAEGGTLLTLPHVMHNALASELFFASRKLTAAEALRLGLVTRTLWPDKFQEELISAVKIISRQSLQSMQAIKRQLRNHLSNIESSLKSESSILIQHWTSDECQHNFSNYSLATK